MKYIFINQSGSLVSLGQAPVLPDGAIEVTDEQYAGLLNETLTVVNGEVV